MKKIIFLVLSILIFCNISIANASTKVSIIADVPAVMKDPSTIYAAIDNGARKIFRSFKFEITPSIEDTRLLVRQYRQDNGLIHPNGSGDFLKTEDVKNIGDMLEADYVFHVEAYPQIRGGRGTLFSARMKYTAICNLKVLNVRTGKFVAMKQFTEDGSSGTSFGALTKHFNAFVPKSIEAFDIDISTL